MAVVTEARNRGELIRSIEPTSGDPAPAPDSRWRYLLSVAIGALVLLAAAGAFLGAWHDGVALTVVALVLAVPAAFQVSGAVIDFCLIVFAERRPALAQLSAEVAKAELAATVVTYPVIVHGDADVDELLDSVCKSRRAAGTGFAMHLVLVDFADNAMPVRDSDAGLRAAINEGLADLNASGDGPTVAALFRRRRWNPNEGVYMGWERKRGKLEELTDLIAGAPPTSFDGDTPKRRELIARLRGMRYILTLDVGNVPLPDGLWRIVATIAHPDNTPVIDPDSGIVVRGYGFVRAVDIPAKPTTIFEWALQPYAIPDGEVPLSQSLFGRDAFFGQGVIDVAAYRAVLVGRIPSNLVLSHDKLEGMHGRAAAIADARVVEATIPDYLQFRRREHRWIRGDVQVLPWVVTRGRNKLRGLPVADRVQLVKDVLTHLYAVSIVSLLALGWLAAPAGQVGWWTLAAVAALAASVMIAPLFALVSFARVYVSLRRRPRTARSRHGAHDGAAGGSRGGRRRKWLLPVIARKSIGPAAWLARVESRRVLVWIPLLADRALVASDALVRAAYRMLVSRLHILQWTSSTQANRIEPGIMIRFRHLWPSCVATLLLGTAIALVDPARLIWAGPFLVAWLAAPLFAYRTGRPARRLPRSTF